MNIKENSFKLIRKTRLAPPASKIGAFSITAICVLSFIAATSVGFGASESYQLRHTDRTRSIAEALPTNELDTLQGTDQDLEQEDYSATKDRLRRIKESGDGMRSVYITALRDNTVFYIADSEDSQAKDYSSSGQLYDEPSKDFYDAFRNRNAFFSGPFRDSSGIWMTSQAPIFDKDNGKFIGMLGIDSPASEYYLDIAPRMLVPLFIAMTASLLLWKIDHVRRKHEEIVNLKNQFVSIASHELRSPLTGMLWAIQSLLNDKNITKAQADILNDMYKSAESSMATINEILDLSAFERHKVSKLQKVDMDLNAAMREVIKNLKLSAEEKHIVLNSKELDEPAVIVGDPGAIKRSMMNIVSNAIKYSPAGSTVACSYARKDKWHRIKISDHGIGIPKKDQKKVLSGYFRAKNAIKIQNSGTGLGLYVTKLIIEKHGGSFAIESEEGKGTTITVLLPAKNAGASPTGPSLSA